MIGWRTIRDGQAVAVWNRRGRVDIAAGPRLLWLTGQSVAPLQRHCAENNEYLVVKHTDGHVDHLRGPATIWQHPVEHVSVATQRMIEMDANEALVVYRQVGNQVERRVERGPALFMPEANEWLHHFRWHGSDKIDTGRKLPAALKFTKLRVIPDQMYFDVQRVRTADDALLTIEVMIFFELVDIERMLDQTHDPIADFVNALSADVIDFVGHHPFEQFKDKTDQLNELAAYPHLVGRSERIGYRINKVVYRGYLASEALQTMHDNAIEKRTSLKLDAETERQAQELADLKLDRELQREERTRESQQQQAQHNVALEQLAHEEQMRQAQVERDAEFAETERSHQLELQHERAVNQEKTSYLASMREMQIDLTRYLVAQYQHPDRLIKIDGNGRADMHLHEN